MSNEGMKDGLDFASATVAVASVAEFLPPLAALFAIIWTCIRLYEWARVALFKKPPRGLT